VSGATPPEIVTGQDGVHPDSPSRPEQGLQESVDGFHTGMVEQDESSFDNACHEETAVMTEHELQVQQEFEAQEREVMAYAEGQGDGCSGTPAGLSLRMGGKLVPMNRDAISGFKDAVQSMWS